VRLNRYCVDGLNDLNCLNVLNGYSVDSGEKPSVHPSRVSGRTEEPLKWWEIFRSTELAEV
jgi:hypothetical protein